MNFGEIQRNLAIFFSTIPEALPAGILFLGIFMADYAFLVFGIGLILTYVIGGILRNFSSQPDTYTLQCSPWKLNATLNTLVSDFEKLTTVSKIPSIPFWISPHLSIIAFATLYIITSVFLLRGSFDGRVASYADTTTGFSVAACLAVLIGYTILRFATGCENVKSLIISLLFGSAFGAGWAVAMGIWSLDLVNIVHIPRIATNQPDAKVILCSGNTSS